MKEFTTITDAATLYNVSVSTLRRALDKMTEQDKKQYTRKGAKNRIEVQTEFLNKLFKTTTERPPDQPTERLQETSTDLVVLVQNQNEQLNRYVEELMERIKELNHLLAMEKQKKQIEQGTHPAPATERPTNTNYLLLSLIHI